MKNQSLYLLAFITLVFPLFGELNKNQRNVQEQLQSITQPTPQEGMILNELANLEEKELQHALNQLSGEQYTSLAVAHEITGSNFLHHIYASLRPTIITEPCPYACCSELPIGGIWLQGAGGQTFINNCKHAHNTLSNNYLVSAGAHFIYDCDLTFGIAAGYGENHLDYHRDGKGKSRYGFGGLYGLYRPLGYYIFADLAYGNSSNTLKRHIQLNDLGFASHSRPESHEILGYIETGMDCFLWDLLVQPFLGLEGNAIFCSRNKEWGGSPLNLSVSSHSFGNVYSHLGAHITMDMSYLLVSADVTWKFRLNPAHHKIAVRFQSFGDKFNIKDVKRGQSYFEGALAIVTPTCRGFNAYAEISGFVGYHSAAYQGLIGVKLNW